MKNILNLYMLIFCSFLGISQIDEKFNGCWLPEKYFMSVNLDKSYYSKNSLFPIEGFEIFNERTNSFIKEYGLEIPTSHIGNILLIKTFKSEVNSIYCEKINDKYLLTYFETYLNMKYISRKDVEEFKKAKVFISIEGEKLLVEIIKNKKSNKIYFINKLNDYEFQNIEDAKLYLENNINGKSFSGLGSSNYEFLVRNNNKRLKLTYEFFKASDRLFIYNQNDVEIFDSGMISTIEPQIKIINLNGTEKLKMKLVSEQSKSKWQFKFELVD